MSQPGDSSRLQSAQPSQPGDSAGHPEGFSRTSIALICSFLVCLIFFVYLSSKPPRVSEPVRASSSRPRRSTPKRPKPKLWDIYLDDHPHHVLEPPDKAVCSWRPLTAWSNDDPTSDAEGHRPLHPEMMMESHVAMAQVWFRGAYPFYPRAERSAASQYPVPPAPPEPPPVSDHRMLNVAILVAMPLRRKPAPSFSEFMPHPAIGSGLSYDEGQLVMGVTSLPYEEQAMRDALRQRERST